MRRGLVHALAWSLATGAAVTLSWWGVRTALDGTAYDPPRALPVTADATPREPEPTPSPASTRRSQPSPSPSPTATPSPRPSEPAGPSGPRPSEPTAPSAGVSGSPASGEVRSYATDGGRAVFDLRGSYATLVSATPETGWSMQVWKTQSWIRVEFGSGAERVSVFCTWHDGPPRVEVGTY
ncbi:hypothetical protein [Streptomyces sp. enrichment culture]|uniref:hypothetical protein n=1 Tax=Streptomyces sp. enrichment culture TaxID=1795815 RepID=UPI003F54EE13